MQLKSYAAETHQGPFLQINEDGYEVDLNHSLYFVVDGFGGSGIGDKCTNYLKENIKHLYTQIGGDPDSTLPFFYSPKYLVEGNALINAILASHKKVFEDNMRVEMSQRSGASAVFAVLAENVLTLVGTGNCRAFLFRKGSLEDIILDDSLRYLGEDQHNVHLKTSPCSGFGLFEQIHFTSNEVKIHSGDLIFLATDGIYSRFNNDEIKYFIANSDYNLSERIKNLFDSANSRGNLDNQTGMLLQF